MASPIQISVNQLSRLVGTHSAPFVLDVRTDEDFADDPRTLPAAVEDVFYSHRGDECTFDTLLNEFGLQSEPLNRLATVVRGADTDRLDLAPQSAGLMAVSLGLSRMVDNDIEQLQAGMLIYDVMYRWARDAFNEKHEWPAVNTAKSEKPQG